MSNCKSNAKLEVLSIWMTSKNLMTIWAAIYRGSLHIVWKMGPMKIENLRQTALIKYSTRIYARICFRSDFLRLLKMEKRDYKEMPDKYLQLIHFLHR